MLISSEILFNQADFERRLRHYFSDSAPCAVSYQIGLDYISVFTDPGEPFDIKLDGGLSVEDNIRIIINQCEGWLYPKIAKITEETVPLPADKVASLLNKGETLVEIMEKACKRKKEQLFIITRVGLNNNTLVLREVNTEIRTTYKLLYITALKFLELLKDGKFTPETAYNYLMENSYIMKEGA